MIDHQPLSMTGHVARGKKPGPCLLVSAGIHGNEICGVEVARLLLKMRLLKRLRGDLIIGCCRDAAVDEGDALFHIALTHDPAKDEIQIQKSGKVIEDSLGSQYTGE